MDETMTGVFKCRCCGWEIEEGDNDPHMDT